MSMKMLNAMLQANLVGQPETAWKYSFYTIVPDGMRWDQTTDTTKYPYIVDTGTTMLYLPPRKCPLSVDRCAKTDF